MSAYGDENYDFFVSYYENLADDLAERVYKVIYNDFGRTVYVNHIVRDKMPGYFEANIENIIRNCKVFILVNTRGALSRPRDDHLPSPSIQSKGN
jgi:hypothetical protein